MFGLFSRTRSAKTKTIDRRPRPWVEQLETRDCPAAIVLQTPTVLADHEVLLTGQVLALFPDDFTVTFSGAVSATTATDAAGIFSLLTSDATLGAVSAVGAKGSHTTSNTASGLIAVAAPSLSLSLLYDSPSTVTLSGTVTDIDAAGETVAFSGVAGGSTTCDVNGNFSYTTGVSGVGAIDATATDLWGQASNSAEVDVTAAPTLTLNTQVLAGHQVQLTGTVSGTYAAGATVTFSGAATGSTTADANGNYTFTTASASLGAVSAVAVDTVQHPSDSTAATIAENAPTITLAVTGVAASTVTLSGTVTDIDAAGESVAISGALDGSVTADANGNFSFTLATSDLETVDVNTTDLWGQASNTAEVAANSFPPVIQGFTAVQSAGNTWIFEGTVIAPNPQGLTVTIGGLPSLAGQPATATVAADGTFCVLVTLGNGEYGTATAQTTDQNGQNSNVANAVVAGFLLDQSDYDAANAGSGVASQVFSADMSAYNSYTFVHFSVPSGGWNINSAATWIETSGSVPDFTTAELVILPEASGGGPDTSTVVFDATLAANIQTVGSNIYKVALTGLNINLSGGDYYVAIAPCQDWTDPSYTQTYILPEISSSAANYDAWFYNPGGGMGYGATPVTTASMGVGNGSFAYAIYGTAP